MDLLGTIRKEGSRGGQGDFKWSDVQASSRREHYLGHSLMAPVGRWQKGRDLNWYAKGEKDEQDEEDPAEKAERERKDEIRRIKEAEEDALARALGLPVAPRNNANQEPVSDKRAVDKAMNEAIGSDNHHQAKGIGYGSQAGPKDKHVDTERIEDEDTIETTIGGVEAAVDRVNGNTVIRNEITIIHIKTGHGKIVVNEGLAHEVLIENEREDIVIVQGHHVVHTTKIAEDTKIVVDNLPYELIRVRRSYLLTNSRVLDEPR